MKASRSNRRGFTLLEVMFALVVLTTAIVGLFSGILHISRLNALNRENLTALRAAAQMIEVLKTTDFDRIFPSYNAIPSDDPPPGPGTAPGATFDVPGLVAPTGGRCGLIQFPTDSSGRQLREDVNDPDLRMPRDLNLNGVIDSTDVAATCRLLPVAIRIEWVGVAGHQSRTFRTILLRRTPL